jgi:hypothetical protein
MKLDLTKLENVRRQPDGSIICACPQCRLEGGDHSKTHLKVYRSGAYNCAKYGSDKAHNSAIKAYLCNTAPGDNPDVEYVDPEPMIKMDKVYPESSLSSLIPDYSYWAGRGICEGVCRRLESGVAQQSEKSKLSGRSVFPCRDMEGRIIGFAARLLEENSFAPKWKILGKKSNAIFPSTKISRNEIRSRSEVILVEGIGCVMALGQVGIWNTMCLFGLNVSSKQLAYLLSLGVKRVIIATNNEASEIGNEAARKLENRLRAFFSDENIIVHLPYNKDFMEMSEEKIVEWHQSLQKPCI